MPGARWEQAGARPLAFALVLGLGAALFSCGAVHTDAETAGSDYAVQGEYAGEGLGVQVVARGEGSFGAFLLSGGLPGAGWDGSPRAAAEGELRGEETLFSGGWSGSLRDGELHGETPDGESFSLRKQIRESPSLGAAPPEGALVLFDGSDVGDFDGELDDEGNLAAGATSKPRFGSFELHLEFRTPFMPSYAGQRRGNSGVFLQNRYEIQVLDSFGLRGEANEAGALYGQHAPAVNMAFPPLHWQTYDVVFEAARFDSGGRRSAPARVSLRHNGVLVHDRAELSGPMDDGDPEGPEPGPLHLQDLWTPVAYRNIWLRPLDGDQ